MGSGRISVLYASSYANILIYDIDAIVICGDFNSRIGNAQDINNTVDNIPCRLVKDQTQNQHGNSFIEFLNDTRICILNGRYGDDSNNYTFQSSRGQSVVDFTCVPHDIFNQRENFRIFNCKDITEQHSLFQLLGEKSRPPDHAVLLFDLKISCDIGSENTASTQTDSHIQNHNKKRFNLRRIPNTFMKSEITKQKK